MRLELNIKENIFVTTTFIIGDFDYDFETQRFTPDTTTISPWVSHKYSEPNLYEAAVKYIDDDGVEGDMYTFRIEIKNFKRYYYVKDHLGSIRQTIDNNGVVVEKQDYSAYGAILIGRSMNTASSNEKYKFTEKERDKESGLDYFGARYYDSEIGRWLSIDPLADKYPGWSPYNYCEDNPLGYIDHDGRGIWDVIVGIKNSIVDNSTMGITEERKNANYENSSHGRIGEQIGNALSLLQSAGEFIGGSGIVAGGSTIVAAGVATGPGELVIAPAGAATVAGGVTVIAHSTSVGALAVTNMMNNQTSKRR